MDKSDVTLERMRSFVRVAERGSLSAVARELEVGQSTISRHLRELETAVGVALLSRTTRRVTLTEEGTRYYASSIQILRLVEQASDEARGTRGTRGTRGAAAGTIRISCTAAFGVMHLSRLIFDFQDQYPDIGIDLNFTDERVDLVREGVDIALRLGPLTNSSMKLRAVGECTRLLVAAPEYLATWQPPVDPWDLTLHEGIRMSNVHGSDTLVLAGTNGERYTVPFGGHFRVDHGLAAREALAAGRGIGPAHQWLVDDLLAAGKLEIILPDCSLPTVPLNMLIVPERANIARVRLLVDFLVEQIGLIPGVERPHARR